MLCRWEVFSADPWSLSGANEDNRVIHAALLRADVDVITDLNPEIFHQKFIVRDHGQPTAAVVTGSTNLTLTDTGKNPPGNPLQAGNKPQPHRDPARPGAAKEYAAEFGRVQSVPSVSCMKGTNRSHRSSRSGRSGSSRCSPRVTGPRWNS